MFKDLSPARSSADAAQFDRMLQPLLPSLFRYAQSLSRDGDVAQDLVQDAVLRAWRNRATFEVGTNFKAWVFRILRNGFLSYVKRRKTAKMDTYGDDFPQVADVSNQEFAVYLDDVERLWAFLPPEQRRAIELVGIDGESYEDAAAVESVSVGTMKSRASRGRQTLRALVNGKQQVAGMASPVATVKSRNVCIRAASGNVRLRVRHCGRDQRAERA
jgi:RNA polymerase sigma-70 factor (ECF subfamily)